MVRKGNSCSAPEKNARHRLLSSHFFLSFFLSPTPSIFISSYVSFGYFFFFLHHCTSVGRRSGAGKTSDAHLLTNTQRIAITVTALRKRTKMMKRRTKSDDVVDGPPAALATSSGKHLKREKRHSHDSSKRLFPPSSSPCVVQSEVEEEEQQLPSGSALERPTDRPTDSCMCKSHYSQLMSGEDRQDTQKKETSPVTLITESWTTYIVGLFPRAISL